MSERPDIVLTNDQATLTFFWRGDRYQHRFHCTKYEIESAVAEHRESPVFTDLHQQDDLLFLSGNAGIGHWSASVEPRGEGFAFDVAVRLQAEVASLASVYAGESAKIASADASARIGSEGPFSLVTPSKDIGLPVSTVRYKYELS